MKYLGPFFSLNICIPHCWINVSSYSIGQLIGQLVYKFKKKKKNFCFRVTVEVRWRVTWKAMIQFWRELHRGGSARVMVHTQAFIHGCQNSFHGFKANVPTVYRYNHTITGIFGDTYVYKKINKYYICSPCFLILTNLFTLTGSCCVLRGGAADTNVI